ncbi:hypothetical protein BDF22DRAFT_688905 [Syncephalis plumigaleata]|nr:hypothetical protein BDF22DRAFT_688905 [Syncephalis plumigaleata]
MDTDTSDNVVDRCMTRKERRLHAKLVRRRNEIHCSLASNTGQPISTIISNVPTRILCLLNAASGGVASVTYEELEATLKQYHGYMAIQMTLGKPCSFAIFDTAENATSARVALDGKISPLLCKGKGKLLLVDYAVGHNLASTNTLVDKPIINENNVIMRSFEHTTTSTINIEEVPGLTLVTEYITRDEELMLLNEFAPNNEIATNDWTQVQERYVQHYGHLFDYDTNRVRNTQKNIPECIEQLLDRLPDVWPRPNQLTVSYYPTGSGIPPHVDSHQAFGDTVYSFSLGNPIMMELRPTTAAIKSNLASSSTSSSRTTLIIDLPPRSVLVMREDARYLWEHSIRARHSDVLPNGQLRPRRVRVSFTMRPINERGRCNCPWPEVCQLRNKGLPARD